MSEFDQHFHFETTTPNFYFLVSANCHYFKTIIAAYVATVVDAFHSDKIYCFFVSIWLNLVESSGFARV